MKKFFETVLRFALVVVLLTAFSFIIVYPIWFFAEHFSRQYSFAVSFLLLVALLFFVIRACIRAYRRDAKKFFRKLGKIILFVVTFAFSVFALFQWNRLSALLIFIAPFAAVLLFKVCKTKRV